MEHLSNDESGNDEEDVHANETSTNPQIGVIRNNGKNCDSSQTLNIGSVMASTH